MDISLNFGPADILLVALMTGWPGLLVGGFCGAVLWRGHRLLGAALGAFTGLAFGLAAFFWWSGSRLSQTLGFPEAAEHALVRTLPEILAGAAICAWFWKSRRGAGAALGALLGAGAGLAIWIVAGAR